MGTGLGGVAAGSVLIALHESPIEDGVRRPSARNTRLAGAVVLGVGGAVGLVGALWLVLGANDEATDNHLEAANVTLIPSASNVGLLVTTRF